jgi:hypothetical protein
MGYGYPIWRPEPNQFLSDTYQRLGTRIGDVGFVTSNGSFDYLFNVCRPKNHPINVNRTPEDFEYVELREEHDVCGNSGAYTPDEHVASTSMKKRVLDAGLVGNQSVFRLPFLPFLNVVQSRIDLSQAGHSHSVHLFIFEGCDGQVAHWRR